MILSFVLLTLLVLLISVLIMVMIHVVIPMLSEKKECPRDTIVADEETQYIQPETSVLKKSDNRAFVYCAHDKTFNVNRSVFNPSHTCFMINSDNGTGTDCKYSCIGLGDCAKICPQQAIKIVNYTAVVTSLCVGCGKCVDVCPLNIIKMIPKDTERTNICSNCTKYPTSCSKYENDSKVQWNDKKDFKIWTYCYKIFMKVIKN